MKQCRGVKRNGERCLRMLVEEDYCKTHRPQASSGRTDEFPLLLVGPSSHNVTGLNTEPIRVGSRVNAYSKLFPQNRPTGVLDSLGTLKPVKKPVKRPGFIYVYTYSSFLPPYLALESCGIQAYGSNKQKTFKPKLSDMTLIKVGMTTSTITGRLHEWEGQCKTSVTCLQPFIAYFSVGSSLIERFKQSLTIGNLYDNYRDNGFYCTGLVRSAEKEIHRRLHEQYGVGDLVCPKCSQNGKPRKHKEWFMVPKTDLRQVFSVIDKVCTQMNEKFG